VKLHSPDFEKKLRRGIKEAVRSSPAPRKKRGRKRPRQYNLERLLGRPLIAAAVGGAVWHAVDVTGHPPTGLAVMTLWAFGWIFLRAQGLLTTLFSANDLFALVLLPIADLEVFRWQVSKFCRASLMSLADLVLGLGVLALYVGLPGVKWLALAPIAVLAWALMLAWSMLLAARCPGLPYSLISSAFVLAGAAVVVLNQSLGPPVMAFIDRHAVALSLVLPPGWVSSQFLVLTDPRYRPAIWLLVPACLVLLTARDSLVRLQSGYRPTEAIDDAVSDVVPDEEPSAPIDAAPDTPLRVEPAAIEELILSRRFFAPVSPARRDWFEERLHRWSTAREKALADFAFPDGFAIVAPWARIFRSLAIGIAVAFLLSTLVPSVGAWMLGLALVVVCLQAFGQFFANGTAFEEMSFGGVKVHAYAAYGIGFRELTHFLVKCSLVQLPLVVVCLTGCSLAAARLTQWPAATALRLGLKASAFALALRFLVLVISFSSGTNDTASIRRAAAVLGLALLSGGAFLALAGAAWYVTHPVAWLFGPLAVLEAYLFLRVYGALYNRMRFDLMPVPRP